MSTRQRAELPPIHRLWLVLVALNGIVLATAPFIATTMVSRLSMMSWGLLYLGVQIGWAFTLVGDAQLDGRAGALRRGGVAFFMLATCFIAELWTGFVLAHLLRAAAHQAAKAGSSAVDGFMRGAVDAGKLLLAALAVVVLDLVLAAKAQPVDENLGFWEALSEQQPSFADEYGQLNAVLLSAFHVAYAAFAWMTIRRVTALLPGRISGTAAHD